MIQNRLNDKEKDIQGLKKQTSSLLNCAWEKGYVAGFDDGYKTGRQAEERPKGKWENTIPENPTNGDMLLTMFDAATVYGIDKENDCIAICMDNNFYQKFRYSWWNAPYKRGEEE